MKTGGTIVIYCLVINIILIMFLQVFAKHIDVYAIYAIVDMILLAISWGVALVVCMGSFLKGKNIFVPEEEN